MVGRDVPGAPRPRDAHGDAIGDAIGTRAAEDVGPYHAPRHVRQRMPRPHTHAMRAPMVGRDVPGAPHRTHHHFMKYIRPACTDHE